MEPTISPSLPPPPPQSVSPSSQIFILFSPNAFLWNGCTIFNPLIQQFGPSEATYYGTRIHKMMVVISWQLLTVATLRLPLTGMCLFEREQGWGLRCGTAVTMGTIFWGAWFVPVVRMGAGPQLHPHVKVSHVITLQPRPVGLVLIHGTVHNWIVMIYCIKQFYNLKPRV